MYFAFFFTPPPQLYATLEGVVEAHREWAAARVIHGCQRRVNFEKLYYCSTILFIRCPCWERNPPGGGQGGGWLKGWVLKWRLVGSGAKHTVQLHATPANARVYRYISQIDYIFVFWDKFLSLPISFNPLPLTTIPFIYIHINMIYALIKICPSVILCFMVQIAWYMRIWFLPWQFLSFKIYVCLFFNVDKFA